MKLFFALTTVECEQQPTEMTKIEGWGLTCNKCSWQYLKQRQHHSSELELLILLLMGRWYGRVGMVAFYLLV